MAPTENNDDDRRVHRRKRRRKRTHENVESSRYETQLRRRLSNTSRLPDVPPDARQGAAREKPV